eukprot:231191-Chlamydomonas_euryale.AAC.8
MSAPNLQAGTLALHHMNGFPAAGMRGRGDRLAKDGYERYHDDQPQVEGLAQTSHALYLNASKVPASAWQTTSTETALSTLTQASVWVEQLLHRCT